MKILEKELNEKIKIFNNKDVIIILDDIVETKFYMNNIDIEYNHKTGYLYIKEKTTNSEINLNTASTYFIELTDNILHIKLDNSLDFRIILR